MYGFLAVISIHCTSVLAARSSSTRSWYWKDRGKALPSCLACLGLARRRTAHSSELFTTVKNIGHRKALRALQSPAADIAAAIARRDATYLVALPEIGKRTAETIIAELSGKLDAWLAGPGSTIEMGPGPVAGSPAADAVTMLIALGERPETARQLVDRALSQHPDIDSPEALLAQVMAGKGP